MSESEKKPFSDERWNDTSKPKIIGNREIPDEEKKENKKQFREHLKKIGVIKEDE
ncbi:hypothetical protein [Paenibacillus sp. SYP-B4298]|uniref:hypothetical protein n=1 Tax=Paenibacillus sp. SYP-B4298 TaxID=2996034 RepID=UPI0022DD75A9|nr:hypothetical protein [Paenibacillus sp. SYP-B4298]